MLRNRLIFFSSFFALGQIELCSLHACLPTVPREPDFCTDLWGQKAEASTSLDEILWNTAFPPRVSVWHQLNFPPIQRHFRLHVCACRKWKERVSCLALKMNDQVVWAWDKKYIVIFFKFKLAVELQQSFGLKAVDLGTDVVSWRGDDRLCFYNDSCTRCRSKDSVL